MISLGTPWLRRCAVLLAAASLFCIIAGDAFTSNEERPFYSLGQTHLLAAAFVGIFTIGLVVCLLLVERRPWMRRLAWIALAAVIVESLLGFITVPQPPGVRVAHALLAQLFFAATAAMAVFTSRAWAQIPEQVRGWPLLRTLAMITAVVVLVQAALGVAFRHGIMDVTLHALGALVVAIVVVVLAMLVLHRPEHQPLRPAVVTLLVVTAVQVFLGLALFSISFGDFDPEAVIIMTMLHAAAAALTLAATLVTVVLVSRNVPTGVNR